MDSDIKDFHIEEDSHWEVLQGCKLCQCESVCNEFGMCMELALDAKYTDSEKSEHIKRKVKNLSKFTSTERALMRLNESLGTFLKKKSMKSCNAVHKPKINLTSFEKLAISLIGK